uniref:Fibronectin type-III domain-containing protein n=1 Tax=Anopheles atroparvus TaxID=41427 RepID=A0AAG5D5Y7_ANOAO
MMEVDQPVVSQVDKEVVPEETAGAVKPESSVASPDKIIEESDDLPALVISDSEGDEMPAAEAEKDKASKPRQDDGDVSGVTPLDASVIDVDAKDENASKLEDAGKDPPQQAEEEVPKPTQNTAAEKQNKEPPNIYENIDLTGSSSADDSGVSDEGCELTVKKVHENVAKVVKDSSQLTAQELLESLLGLQQDAADEEARVNEAESTEQREPKSGVEPQLDQEKEVSTPPERDPVCPQEQAEKAPMGDKSAEEPASLRLSVNSPTAIAVEGTDCAEFDSKQSTESVTVAEAAEKDQGTKKPIPCVSQSSRSTTTSKDAGDYEDDEDDVVCLLEEMDDPIGINIDGEDEHLDESISSSADIASTLVVGGEGQTKGNENECTLKALLLESKDSEVDSNGEPPNKRPRSEGHHLDEGVTAEPLAIRDNFDISSKASSQHSNDNHQQSSESRKAENSHQAQERPPVRSRPSSSVGDSMVPMESLNTADSDANAQDSAQTLPDETQSQYSDVLVIDDDEDDDEINDEPAKIAEKLTAVEVKARVKRPRDADEPERKEKSHPEDSPSATSAASASPVQDSSAKRLKSMELVDSKPLHMEFMKNMSKPIGSMSRDELEEIVLQKICQAMKYESELVEERKRGDKIVKAMQNLRQRLADMSKQYSDLKVVHDRVVLDLRRKRNGFVQPVRITRAVGLQVNQPPQLSFQTFRASMETSTNAAANHSAEQSVIPADGNGSPGREGTSGSGGTSDPTRDQTTKSAQGTDHRPFVQRVADGFVGSQHPAPNVIRTSRPMNVTFVHGAKASAVTIKPTGSSRNNGTSVEGGQRGGSNSPSGSSSSSVTGSTWSYRSATGGTPNGETIGSPSSGSVTARKKTVHKITPKRPPLSAVQQEEQDKMARQQQELFLQDMYNQQARMAKIAANSKGENSSPNVGDVGQQNAAGTTVTQIRTALAPPQASVPPQVSTASNVRANNRMAPSITNSMTLAGEKQPAPAVTSTAPQQSHPSSAAHNSLIDLTDEEESPRVSSGGGAAPNLSAHNRQNDQNGTLVQPNTPTISLQPPELVASNQMLKLSLVARQQNKHKVPQRILNGHVSQRPPATNANASNPSGTKFGSMNPNRAQGFRPVLSKRPSGHMLPAGMLMNGQARHPGPTLPLYPAGAGQRPLIKLPNHLPPLPLPEKHNSYPQWKKSPPMPSIRINNVPTGIVISWSMPDLSIAYADIEKYQIYAYQETNELQATDGWRHVGDVNALPLPMAVTLTHFNEGQRYHFAVRAIDQHKRSGFFSEPRTW